MSGQCDLFRDGRLVMEDVPCHLRLERAGRLACWRGAFAIPMDRMLGLDDVNRICFDDGRSGAICVNGIDQEDDFFVYGFTVSGAIA